MGFLRETARCLAGRSLGRYYACQLIDDLPPDLVPRLVPLLERNESVAMEALFNVFDRTSGFDAALSSTVTTPIRGFEDLTWLFACNLTNMAIAQVAFDEGGYLFRLVRSLGPGRCLEIGRYKGGSTFLFAAALVDPSMLVSIDNHGDLRARASRRDLVRFDEELRRALMAFGIAHRVDIVVADSTKVPAPPDSFDFVFIDGDHSYPGVARDYHHWKDSLKPGGHLLFHDAAAARPFATQAPGVASLVREIEQQETTRFARIPAVGSLAHFVRAT